MTGKFKALGLALVAAMAMSAVVAASASATAFQFHSETAPTQLTGKQHAGNDVFTTDAGTVSCNEATYVGTQSAATTGNVSVTPTYSGCTAFGFLNVPIHTNGCSYQFNAVTLVNGNYEGSVDINCPTGKVIEVTAPECVITVPAQKNLTKVTYTNLGANATREVTVDVAITGITYVEHRTGLFSTCGFSTGHKNNGTYNGAGLVTGENPTTKAHHGIWVG